MGVSLQPLSGDHGAVPSLPLGEAAGDQRRQVAKPKLVLAQQHQPGGFAAIVPAPQTKLGADDGLDAMAQTCAVELDHGEHVVELGDGRGLHPQARQIFNILVDAQQAIHQGVLSVNPQVGELGFHGCRAAAAAAQRRTGAKLRRWLGQGPRRARAWRCCGVG